MKIIDNKFQPRQRLELKKHNTYGYNDIDKRKGWYNESAVKRYFIIHIMGGFVKDIFWQVKLMALPQT